MSTYRFDVEKIQSSRPADAALIVSIILLAGVGMVTLFSASSAFAERFFGSGTYFVQKQATFGAVGLILMIIVSTIDIELIRRWIKPLILGSLFLCVLTFIPGIGLMKNGAARWIKFGSFSYQPSELVKLALPIYLAHFFAKKENRLDNVTTGVVPPAIIVSLFCLFFYLQNNFSTAAFIGINSLAIFFLAGIKLRHFVMTAVVSIPLMLLMIFSKEYRIQRLLSFMEPEKDLMGVGYQVHASVVTLLSGGFWGKGLGRGTRKIASVPEVHSDFIFSAYGEEFGFFGVLLLFALFAFFAYRGLSAGIRSDDTFKRLLAFGLTLMIVSQALLNLAVVVGAVPATGVTLPFFSAGGSSLATTLLMAGLLINISRKTNEREAGNVR
ncbi:MAG: putative lipid II flippase FtsW [Treponemataceae bacterium]